MNIGVAYDNGQIAANLGSCRQVLIVTTEGREPVSKHMAEVRDEDSEDESTLEQLEIRNYAGVSSIQYFLVGEKQGDPTLLEIGREEDPDDPMACMHDCAKCSGCGPSELLKSIPVEEIK